MLRAQLLDRQARRESAARTYARTLPVAPVAAAGAEVTGADGRTYLDCLSGAGTLALGHNHPRVIAALKDALDSGVPLHALDMITPQKDAFSAELLTRLPGTLRDNAKLHFCSPAGTDAVEAALKLARTATGRQGVVAFTGAYHGMTLGASSVSGPQRMRGADGQGPATAQPVTRLPFPHPYRCPFGVGGEEGARLSARLLESYLTDPSSGVATPAAVILEVVQGEGGVIEAPDAWLREIRRITKAHGIVLVVDEVQTGVGRTGDFWACEHAGVTPDILVTSKAVGGGLPLALIAYRPELDAWQPGDHTGTFRGNTLAMVAGEITLRTVAEEQLAEHARKLGDRLRGALRALAAEHPAIGDVRGRGLMTGAELVDPDAEPGALGARPGHPRYARAVQAACLERGLMLELGGRDGTVLRLLPPLVLTDAQADSVLARLAEALTAARDEGPTAGGGTPPAAPGTDRTDARSAARTDVEHAA
ncbi:diaminobutyrate--2-oxoglutarate transaminase family protein [Streptomyces sp. TRM 70351]|uniref:diaminobutyrate--2-oxoglutarate transaminase family protein n=1 Tax=Streptomyces sp. TRM 70351 TaxID=3116552 RepID=UPI002E7B7004|nr:diaminobutyrate--2-oxoglutarate transaminase family protein [Streptomyces sp. TRM 70351]MEE1930508.1 diaminobutyrate--2-oxoglutarate transaminase family protein [Streptomyces sp. TRM 70351]